MSSLLHKLQNMCMLQLCATLPKISMIVYGHIVIDRKAEKQKILII